VSKLFYLSRVFFQSSALRQELFARQMLRFAALCFCKFSTVAFLWRSPRWFRLYVLGLAP